MLQTCKIGYETDETPSDEPRSIKNYSLGLLSAFSVDYSDE
jgi:hypothetical protein